MKTLEFPFTEKGFRHELLERVGRICLVRRSKPDSPAHYEVVRLLVYPAEERFGKPYPEREGYPPASLWGTFGFTYTGVDLAGARRRFAKLSATCAGAAGSSPG